MANRFHLSQKKYYPWLALVLVCLFIVFWGKRRMNRAADQLDRLEKQIQFTQTGPIQPSAAVLDSLNQVIEQLQTHHSNLDAHLFSGPKRMVFDGDSTAAYFELASFIETSSLNLQSKGIAIAEGERFGFSQFEQQGPSEDILYAVIGQKHAASVILDVLLEAQPDSLTFLKRELVVEEADDAALLQQAARNQSSSRTQYEDTLFGGEKIEGFESYTFELQFEGYTEALRRFLKGLTHSELPVMVTQLRVQPLDRYEEPEKSLDTHQSTNPFDILASVGEEEDSSAAVPIIRNNLSAFNVRLEVFLGEEVHADS